MPTDAKLANASIGLRYYLTDRFVARLDYSIYTAYVADTRSAGVPRDHGGPFVLLLTAHTTPHAHKHIRPRTADDGTRDRHPHGANDAAPAQQNRANEQVIEPKVERRDVKLPHFPSKDFEVGVFGGTYATQNFGASAIGGLRVGYHISEDIFVEGVLAQTKVSDDTFRQILPGGVFAQRKETLRYYNLSAGYNVLPGEVFIGSNRAKATADLRDRRRGQHEASSIRSARPSTSGSACGCCSPTAGRCRSTCAITSSRSICSASARARRTSS